MNRRRLILTAALALAPVGPAPALGQPAPPFRPGMPPAVIDKLLKLIAALGVDTVLPAPIAAALGLGAAGQPWPDRQFAVQSEQDGSHHAVAIHRGADPDMIFSVSGPAAISIFRAHRDGALVGATAYFPETHLTANLPLGQSQADFAAEGAFWAAHVDALLNQL
ncbi:MAG: hypothetical protein JWO83_2534 [Caulobacteraceae bacterium]|jgi:hypothetical protein|nr:hypothetical protein [Caulobacteraceae bacterium]